MQKPLDPACVYSMFFFQLLTRSLIFCGPGLGGYRYSFSKRSEARYLESSTTGSYGYFLNYPCVGQITIYLL